MVLKVFVDFDGTVTRQDVGNAFFRHFGGVACDELVTAFRAGNISAKECFRHEAASLGRFDPLEARDLVRYRPIDPSFRNFVQFCIENNIALSIVSDGFDYYIAEILEANGIAGVPFFANHLTMIPVGGARVGAEISFPFDDAECTRCACCKRNIMLGTSGEEDIIVYVGEGFSDRCPVQYADIVFAKDDLQVFCQRENISYFTYTSFLDVSHRLSVFCEKRNVKKRRRAEIKRREAFMCE